MYVHATTYPALRARRARRVRAHRSPGFFLRRTTQHVRVSSARRRVRSVSWVREIVRVGAALASIAAWSAVIFVMR